MPEPVFLPEKYSSALLSKVPRTLPATEKNDIIFDSSPAAFSMPLFLASSIILLARVTSLNMEPITEAVLKSSSMASNIGSNASSPLSLEYSVESASGHSRSILCTVL